MPSFFSKQAGALRSRWKLLAGGIVLLCGSLWLLDWWFPLPLPDRDSAFARLVTDRHGQPLRAFADANGIWRYPTTVDAVSPYYLEALLTYEDR